MENRISTLFGNRQLRLFALLFLLVLALLGAAYYFFIRTEYSVLFSDLRPAEASAIVTELDRQDAAYQLRDDGATVLVPSDRASSTRVALAGSDLSLRGMVGFELFNESDMGLTDFAQRVNFQRALQGELSRTIMLMDGIENARVHLAMPERSLFRGNRSQPRAAVTVISRRGQALDERRVTGIQRLVAAAVPDLSVADVVVLDAMGRPISAAAAPESLSPDVEEHSAIQQYYRARARTAVQAVLPDLQFEVRVMVLPRNPGEAIDALAPEAADANQAPPAASAARNFRLRLAVLTASELNPADQASVRNAVAQAVGLDEGSGDALMLSVAPVDVPAPPAVSAARLPEIAPPLTREEAWPSLWWLLLIGAVAIALALLMFRPRGPVLATTERDLLVRRIRDQLGAGNEVPDVRA